MKFLIGSEDVSVNHLGRAAEYKHEGTQTDAL